MSWLALSDSFEYLCYRSAAITHIFILTAGVPTLVVRILRLKTSNSDDWSRSPRFNPYRGVARGKTMWKHTVLGGLFRASEIIAGGILNKRFNIFNT